VATSLSDSKIASLEPWFRPYAQYMYRAFNDAGWPLIVVSGRRSEATQRGLIQAGATTATRSYHLSGLAFDVGLQGFTLRTLPREYWQVIGEYGEALGLRWGGRFSRYDPVHFDAGYLI